MEQSMLENRGDNPDRGAVTHPLPEGVRIERDIRISMRDGVHLAATIYRPESEGRFPVILCVTAYGKDFGPAEYSTLPKIMAAGMAVGTMHMSDVTTWEGAGSRLLGTEWLCARRRRCSRLLRFRRRGRHLRDA